MAAHHVKSAPVVPGYIVHLDRVSGVLTAVTIVDLTEYQKANGCRAEVTARSPRELEWLCTAERVKAELVAKAQFEAAREGEL